VVVDVAEDSGVAAARGGVVGEVGDGEGEALHLGGEGGLCFFDCAEVGLDLAAFLDELLAG
jgi:hypothetical protein